MEKLFIMMKKAEFCVKIKNGCFCLGSKAIKLEMRDLGYHEDEV